MKLLFSKIKFNKYSLIVASSALILVLAVYFITPNTANAVMDAVGSTVLNMLSWGVQGVVWILGKVLLGLIYLVIWVAEYNDFINAPAISNGWVILRDVCNMFFILILLVIAFATTLNQENYGMKKLLPKFILAAILINFSKLICGIIIDFAQVVMLTFVNGFRDIGGGNFADMLGITKLFSINLGECPAEVSFISVLGTYILGLIYIIIATVVIAIILMMLVMRMVMIWIYVVLSPMAWLTSVLPATESVSKQWWKQFTEAVVSGPILAFFIWLSFASAQVGTNGESLLNTPPPTAGNNEAGQIEQNNAPCAGASQAGTADSMLKFVISIGLLIGGLIITKEVGGKVGGIAGSGLDKIKKTATGIGKGMVSPITDRAKAYNKFRQAARAEKMEAFGEKAYGNVQKAKGAVKGSIKTGFSKVKDIPTAINDKIIEKYSGEKGGPMNTFARNRKAARLKSSRRKSDKEEKKNNKIKEKEDKIDYKNRLQEAYSTGIFVDENGDKYNEQYEYKHPDGRTSTRYRRKLKEEDGSDKKDALGNQMYEEAKEKGKIVEKMSTSEFNANNAWNKSMMQANAFSNPKQEARISKEQKKMEDAGFTKGQLQAMLKDATLSKEQRMAVAMALAIKTGFKDANNLREAKNAIGKSGNSVLAKKFNDEVDKKQAHLNYDLNTKIGEKKFGKIMSDGRVLDDSAYKDANVMKILAETKTKDEFANYTRKVSASSSAADANWKEGYRAYLDTAAVPAWDEKTGDAHKSRENVINTTLDLNDSVRGLNNNTGGAGFDAEELDKVLNSVLEKTSSSKLFKLDAKSFKANEKMVAQDPAYANKFKKSLLKAIKANFSADVLGKMMKDKNADKKVIRAMQDLLKEDDPGAYKTLGDYGPAGAPRPGQQPAQPEPAVEEEGDDEEEVV